MNAEQERIMRQARLDGERKALLDWVASTHIAEVRARTKRTALRPRFLTPAELARLEFA